MSTSKQRISKNQPGPFGNSQKDHGIRIHLQRANSAPPRSITDAASAKPGSTAHHDRLSMSKQSISRHRFETANIAPPRNVTDPNRRASRHSFQESFQYSSTSGHRFPATVVHMSCSSLYPCSARSGGSSAETRKPKCENPSARSSQTPSRTQIPSRSHAVLSEFVVPSQSPVLSGQQRRVQQLLQTHIPT